MHFRNRRAVSPIIATLLLIAIAVAGGITVYVFVNGLAGGLTSGGGGQTTERLQMQGFNFNDPQGTSCTCSMRVLQIFLINSGSATTTISSVYYDGVLIPISANNPPLVGAQASIASNVYTATDAKCVLASNAPNAYYCAAAPATAALTAYTVGTTGEVEIGLSAAAIVGTSHIVKIVSSTGGTYVFTLLAGRTG